MSAVVKSITPLCEMDTWDIVNLAPDIAGGQGNFVIDGLVVHNSIPAIIANRDCGNDDWKNKMHPDMLAILESTYGYLVYQEQLQQVWQVLAGFTSPEAQEARKAVAKKWRHLLAPIEGKWIEGATKTLGEAVAKEIWQNMVSFGRYAFNKCLDKDILLIDQVSGETHTIEEWYDSGYNPKLQSWNGVELVADECIDIHNNGIQEVFEIEFDDGCKERVTLFHRFLCDDGEFHTVEEIFAKGLEVFRVGKSDKTAVI